MPRGLARRIAGRPPTAPCDRRLDTQTFAAPITATAPLVHDSPLAGMPPAPGSPDIDIDPSVRPTRRLP